MTERALLPTGLEDILPLDADFDASLVDTLMATFRSHGYDRVKPPLMEFEDNLLQNSGQAVAAKTFRMMDPVSQRMLGIRPDITVQVDRIATTRLSNSPRPLRLSYHGDVLRVQGSHLRPERQLTQAGIEMIGAETAQADAEVIITAAHSLQDAGIEGLSVDLGLPRLVPLLCARFALDEDTQADLRIALDRKDATAVRNLGGAGSDLFAALIDCTGPADQALSALSSLDLKGEAADLYHHLQTLHAVLSEQMPDLALTIDAVENRGYEYHTGVSYTFYALGARGELGRGGRYIAASQEAACGVTLFVDSLRRSVPKHTRADKIFIPFETKGDSVKTLRTQGHICVNALEETSDPVLEAKRLGCSHIYRNNTVESIASDDQ